ncbi:transcription factor IBH1-like [Primulina huaijiensis]|uniref:transcription factor IBH1-like n=1 Tax=Primulina huaijiensis TaxID=1492673 RepID=UPI003CC74734
MTSDHVSSLRNPSSIKTRFAHRFVLALKKLSIDRSPSSPVSMAERYKRYRMVRTAAYASMASSVGPKRAWARALLRKIRNRKMCSNLMKRQGSRTDLLKKRTVLKPRNHREMGSEQENSLRELVPGGEGMEFYRLLNETGHYIKCLRAQVKVMKNIIDLYSN